MLTTIPPVDRRAMSRSRHFLARHCALAGRRVRPRTQVYRCWKNAQIVAISRTPITPYELSDWIHMSFIGSEIGSGECISEEPKSLCDYPPRLSHDDLALDVHLSYVNLW